MRPIIGRLAAVYSVLLTGCTGGGGDSAQSSLSGQPYVVYHTGDNIEVTQYFAGGKNGFNETSAMDLLTKECGGAYRIVKRTKTEDDHTFVDAVCIH